MQFTTKCDIYYSKNKKNENILSLCPSILSSNFKPHFLIPFTLLQTLLVSILNIPNAQEIKYKTEKVNKYGTNIHWATLGNNKPYKEQPILFLMPGMTGVIEDPYVSNIVMHGLKNGYNVVVYQLRLISDDCLLPDDGVFNYYDDIDQALDLVQSKYSGKIYAIGGSYGANCWVYYLGSRNSRKKRIEAAVSLSNPFDMFICQRYVEETIYESIITFLTRKNFRMIKKGVEKCKGKNINIELCLTTEDAKEYDENFTRKVWGFNSADEYYRAISCHNVIKNVNIPLFCISSKDDQLSSYKAIPFDDIRQNENIMIMITNKGGHMGYISNESFLEWRQWTPKIIYEFINASKNIQEKTL